MNTLTMSKDEPVKKGSKSWQPATKLATHKQKPGFRYRWCDKDPSNIERKQAEGWHLCNSQGAQAEHDIQHSAENSLDSAKTHRELVLMAIPEELAEQRAKFYEDKTDAQERGLKGELDAKLKGHGAAQSRGKITIE